MSARIELAGKRFGLWTVIMPTMAGFSGQTMWLCQCDCGVKRSVNGQSLRSGTSTNCGCRKFDIIRRIKTKHGGSVVVFGEGGFCHKDVDLDTAHMRRSYAAWKSMIYRCENPKSKGYKHYGGRGIKVCQRWHDYSLFVSDVGNPPPSMSLDRINVNGDYEPGNVRWADAKTQARNKRADGGTLRPQIEQAITALERGDYGSALTILRATREMTREAA